MCHFCGQVLVPLSRLQPQDQEAPNGGIDDMTKLAYLHEPGVLHNLAVRYDLDEIYVRKCGVAPEGL